MDDRPRHKLRELVQQYGREIAQDAQRCRGLLMDFCGGSPREIFVLVSAVEEKATAELLSLPPGAPPAVILRRLTQRLVERRAISEDAAQWSIESWALALDIEGVSEAAAKTRPLGELEAREPVSAGGKVQAAESPNGKVFVSSLPVVVWGWSRLGIRWGWMQLGTTPGVVPIPVGYDLGFSCQVNDANLAVLAPQFAACGRVLSLTLMGSSITARGLTALESLPSLTALDLARCERLSDRSLERLKVLPRLERLNLAGTVISDAGVKALVRLGNLSNLNLSGCGITDLGVTYLRKVVNLTHLNLEDCRQVSDAGVLALRGMEHLTTMNLRGCVRVTRAAIMELRRQNVDVLV